MEFKELVDRFQKESKGNYDSVVPTNDLRLVAEGTFALTIRGEKFPLTRTGFKTLCHRVGVPYEYFSGNPLQDTARHINYWLEHSKLKDLYVRVQEKSIRGVLHPKFEPYDNLELLADVQQIVGEPKILNYYEQDGKMDVKLYLGDEYNYSEGDDHKFRLGLAAVNSELDDSPLILGLGITRLKCMNDILVNNSTTGRPYFRKSHRSVAREQVKMGIQNAVTMAKDQGKSKADAFVAMRKTDLSGDKLEYIYSELEEKRVFQKTFILQVRKTPIEERTLYGLANQLTAASKNLSFAQRRSVEEFVGNRLLGYVGSL